MSRILVRGTGLRGPQGPPGPASTGTGIPVGGTIGQVLAKNSGTDGDVGWDDPGAGSGATTLDELTDVAVAASTNGMVLRRAAGSWLGVALTADDIGDGSTNHAFTAADDTKLGNIATGATANSSDATLLARANHTGVDAITGLPKAMMMWAEVALGGTPVRPSNEADRKCYWTCYDTADLPLITLGVTGAYAIDHIDVKAP